jgi:hypothetical protein
LPQNVPIGRGNGRAVQCYHVALKARTPPENEETIMDIGTVFKILALLLWPFFLLFLYFLFDRKGFNKQMEKFKKDGFK